MGVHGEIGDCYYYYYYYKKPRKIRLCGGKVRRRAKWIRGGLKGEQNENDEGIRDKRRNGTFTRCVSNGWHKGTGLASCIFRMNDTMAPFRQLLYSG